MNTSTDKIGENVRRTIDAKVASSNVKYADRCFHHVDNRRSRKQGYLQGGCVIRWDVQCAGTPDRAYPQCPGYYIPWNDIERVRGSIIDKKITKGMSHGILIPSIADLEAGEADALMMAFLKAAVASGEIPVIKTAVDGVIRLRGDRYRKILKPLIKAIEIVETGDATRYYSLQVEEREIVAEIVRAIVGYDELCML